MKEIKFRAWDKDVSKMIPFEEIGAEGYAQGGLSLAQHLEPDGSLILMQYTGLKDKNGKEIYEGDILKVNDEIVEVKPPELFRCDAFVVYGYEFCSGYFIENYDKIGLDRFYGDEPEIIGNVYENPELITKI